MSQITRKLYQAAFQVESRDPFLDARKKLIFEVRSWLNGKYRGEDRLDLQNARLFNGLEVALFKRNVYWLDIKVRRYDEIEVWCLRLEHPDSGFSQRKWRTDVTITGIQGQLTFSIVLSTLTSPGWDTMPPHPELSIPRLVRRIIDDHELILTQDDMEIQSVSQSLVPGEFSAYFNEIRQGSSSLAQIVVKADSLNDPENLADTLANDLVGKALVKYVSDVDDEDEVQYYFSAYDEDVWRHNRLPRNAIKVFLPPVDFTSGGSRRQKIFWLNDETEFHEIRLMIQQAINSLVRPSVPKLHPLDFDELRVIHLRMNSKRLWERAANMDEEVQDWFQQAEEEQTKLVEERRSLKDELEMQLFENEELTKNLKRIEYEANRDKKLLREEERKNLQAAKALNDNAGLLVEAMMAKSNWDALKLAEKAYPNELIILRECKSSSESAKVQEPLVVFKSVYSLVKSCLPLLDEGLALNEVVEQFKSDTELELAVNESSQTKSDKSMMRTRTFHYEGKKHLFVKHVKYNKRREHLRLYFEFIDGKVVVAYCGDHLDTAGTRRKS